MFDGKPHVPQTTVWEWIEKHRRVLVTARNRDITEAQSILARVSGRSCFAKGPRP